MAVNLHKYPSMVADLTASGFSDEQTRALVEFIGRVVNDSVDGINGQFHEVKQTMSEIKLELKELRALMHRILFATVAGAFAICVALLGILGTTMSAG